MPPGGIQYYDESSIYQQQHMIQGQQHISSPVLMNSTQNGPIMSDMVSPNAMLNSEMLSPGGTPSRGSKMRPSQPPPAPPSATNSSSRSVYFYWRNEHVLLRTDKVLFLIEVLHLRIRRLEDEV